MDKISVIVPVYNVESYVRRCLDSVISQTYSNLEIICVDDGSTDNSGRICDEYAAKDERIRVFHKQNGGLSSALNVGLDNFTGDYIGFADSDDWLEHDMYNVLYRALKEKYVPISVAGYYKDTDSESIIMSNSIQIPDGIISTRELLLYPLKRDHYMGYCGYVWNKLYSANLVKSKEISFENEIKYGMDIVFYTTVVISNKCTGVYTDKPLYHYYQRDTAITKSKSMDIKKDILKVYKRVEELLNTHGYTDLSFWARGFYCYHASVIANIAKENNDEEILSLMQAEIREHIDDYIETNREFPEKFESMYGVLNL